MRVGFDLVGSIDAKDLLSIGGFLPSLTSITNFGLPLFVGFKQLALSFGLGLGLVVAC